MQGYQFPQTLFTANQWRYNAGDSINASAVGWWPLTDGRLATVQDITRPAVSGSGTLTGCTVTPGLFGRAYRTNGTSDKIVYTVPSSAYAIISISGWMKSIPGQLCVLFDNRLASDSGGVVLYSDNTNNGANFYGYGGGFDVGPLVSFTNVYDGCWHHYFATLSTTVLRLFVDGIYQGTKTITAAPHTARTTAASGYVPFVNAFYQGLFSNLRIWSRILTDAEGLRLYRDPFAGSENVYQSLFMDSVFPFVPTPSSIRQPVVFTAT